MPIEEHLSHIPVIVELVQELKKEVAGLRKEVQLLRHAERLTYNLHEAAAAMGVSYYYLYERFKSGELKCIQGKAGSTILVEKDELIRWIREAAENVELREIQEAVEQKVAKHQPSLKVSHKAKAPNGTSR
jgi:hypothetical protein